MNRTRSAIQQLCRDVIVLDSEEDEAPSLEQMARNARGILENLRPRPAPRKALPARKQDPEPTNAELRVLAMDRDLGACVVCGWVDYPVPVGRLEMHHIIRRQSLACVVMLCHADHQGADSVHSGNVRVLRKLAAYCTEHDMPEAARALAKRIAKAESTERMLPRGTP